ncbi:MAG: aminoacyl-histidine dipeptidase [Spirochaetota bacterium]
MSLHAEQVIAIFEQIDRIPRCSKNEARVGAWLLEWAEEHGFAAERDETGNVLIRVPAAPEQTDAPTLVLQGHMDMVCEKTPDSSHNFETDPIPVITDGEWLHAEDTTLGADNGIAVALALALAESDVPHPPLEILVTVEEETGLTGAQKLGENWLTGRQLLNIDSEDEGIFTVGCAGGRDTTFSLKIEQEDLSSELVVGELVISGLQGGHSGVDIHLGRANANVLLVRALRALRGEIPEEARGQFGELLSPSEVRLASLRGGNAHNAIPRDAAAVIAFPAASEVRTRSAIESIGEVFRAEYGSLEPALQLSLRSASTPAHIMTPDSEQRLLDFLAAMPHGVIRMSSDVPGLVETSTNFATVRMNNDSVQVKTSQRSSYRSRLGEIAGRLESLARLAGASVSSESSYPPWEPHMESELLGRAVEAYKDALGKEPVVEVIHAGLECGVIGAKYPEMQMISFGPTIQNPHSPDERMNIPSLEKTCRFVEALFASYLAG